MKQSSVLETRAEFHSVIAYGLCLFQKFTHDGYFDVEKHYLFLWCKLKGFLISVFFLFALRVRFTDLSTPSTNLLHQKNGRQLPGSRSTGKDAKYPGTEL